MKTIKQTYAIHGSLSAVWDGLINPKTISAWGGGPAKMSDKVGFSFTLWGGDVYGKNIKVIPQKELQQEWFGGKWEKPSILTFTLVPDGETTIVHLLHTNVPDNEAKDIEEGWKDYYMGPLKELIEK